MTSTTIMINFTHGTTRYTVLPEHAEKYRKLAVKPPAVKLKVDRRYDAMRREYPAYSAGMRTAEYVRRYADLNERLKLMGGEFTFTDRAAPMLDASIPEVLEELDPDHVPDFLSIAKPKKSSGRRRHAYAMGDTVSAALYARIAELEETVNTLQATLDDIPSKKERDQDAVDLIELKGFFYTCFESLNAAYPCPSWSSCHDVSVIFDAIHAGEGVES